MSGTPRLALPFISPGQAQTDLMHNEALQLLDFLVAGAVEEEPRVAPPTSPAQGWCYIVAPSATGEWAGKDHSLAAFSSGGWRYVPAVDGMSVFIRSTGKWALFLSGAWEFGAVRGSRLMIEGQQVVGPRAAAIAAPTGGSTIDSEARATVADILAALRAHGLIDM